MASSPIARSRPVPRRRKAVQKGWWGSGPPPHERWPGVTIAIDDCDGRYYFDDKAADRVCGFFPRYGSHSKGAFAGRPFNLLDYQIQLILRPIFGWKRTSDHLRRFQKAYIQIPKKNGKTQLIAGLGLYMLLCDGERGAEIYCAAADKKQAEILFKASRDMIQANPKLGARCEVYRSSIVHKEDESAFFQVLSREAATKHGPNIHCLVIDELHAQPDRDLFETLTRGVIARTQPLILEITTAGNDDESICYEEYDYAKRVLSGTIEDEKHLPVIFEAGDKEDWTDPAVWHRVNPGLGETISLDMFEGFALEAQNEPRKRNDFLRYHLNRWTNQAESWIPVEWWDACKQPFDDARVSGLSCCAGLDLAQKIDLAAFVIVFREFLDGPAVTLQVATEDEAGEPQKREISLNFRAFVLPFFWLPSATVEDRAKEGVSYRAWEEARLLTVTDGATIDYDRVRKDIVEKILPRFPMLKQGQIGYDPAFATDIAGKLQSAGLTVVEVLQNYKYMNEPCYALEGLIKDKRLVHDGNKLLRWNVENVAVKRDDALRIRPVKPKKATKKIDGVVATLMGLRQLMAAPQGDTNVYNARAARGEERVIRGFDRPS